MKIKNEIHDFYCMKCGNKVYSIPRPVSHQYKKHHRKKLWCPWCGMTLNCVECRNDSEIYDFKMMFEDGEFEEELKESLTHIEEENKIWS